ncbi:MAG: hypothetical protein IJZ82_05820 [Lachnospiraceae bacterium]|nr:hypothetical protein [Lachnospiraceae bacterium]
MRKRDAMKLHMYRRKRLGAVLLAGLLCCLSFSGCERNGEEAADVFVKNVEMNPLTEEQTSKVEYGDVIRRSLFDGVITPYVEELVFPEDGIFLEYYVTLGERVEEGQLLAATDVGDAKEQVENYQNQIAELTATYNYDMETKRNSKKIAEIELEMALDQVEAAGPSASNYSQLCAAAGQWDSKIKKVELEMKHLTEDYEIALPYLQEKLEECQAKLTSNQIVAPFDGVVTSMVSLACGDRIIGQKAYIAVSDTTRYQVVGAYVSQKDMEDALGVTAFINGEEYPLTYIPMDEEVYYAILKKGEVPYSTYEIEPGENISHGMFALIVLTESKVENVLKVPGIAVHQDGSRKYCYVKNGDKKEKVYIQVGMYDTMDYEVKDGLEEGDEVYLD